MKAMFAWMSLLAALANLFAVASGQPDPLPPPLPAILKTSVAGVSFCLFCMNFPIKYLIQTGKKNLNN